MTLRDDAREVGEPLMNQEDINRLRESMIDWDLMPMSDAEEPRAPVKCGDLRTLIAEAERAKLLEDALRRILDAPFIDHTDRTKSKDGIARTALEQKGTHTDIRARKESQG